MMQEILIQLRMVIISRGLLLMREICRRNILESLHSTCICIAAKVPLLTVSYTHRHIIINFAITKVITMATSKNVNRTLKLYIDNQEIDGSVKSIKSRIRELTGEMNKLTVGTKEYEERAKKIRELNGILAEHRRNIKAVSDETNTLSSRFGKIADGFNRYMGVIGGAIASLTGLTMTIRKTVQDFADMEEEMAQVRKYTGMTDEEVKELNEDLKALDTRTSREELNKLAGEAGRLEDDLHLARYIKNVIDDPDAMEGVTFARWLATMAVNGIEIEWSDILEHS